MRAGRKFFEKYKEHFLFLSVSPFYTQNFAFGCKLIIRIFCRLFDIVPQGGIQIQDSPRSAPQYFSSAAAATAPSDAAVMTCRRGLTQMSPAA